ncbi:MAG: glycosyltransferase family 4 protein [Devosia sp.]|nr:glycosyltransferase family 4 protein [Devosia sp.]
MIQPPHDRLHVLVATPSGEGGQGGIDRLMDSIRAELLRRNRPDLVVDFMPTRGRGHVAFSPVYLIAFCTRMIGRRLARRLDVVHLNVASRGSTYRKLAIAALARTLGVPTVLHLHGGNYPMFWTEKRPRLSAMIRTMFATASAIVVLGRVWRDFIAGKVPEAAGRIVILPNATPRPTRQHTGGGDHSHILFLGRINQAKGVPELGEALHNMLPLPGWRATIAGDGYVEMARERVVELGLEARVTITGWVDADAVAALIAEADILVLPSHEENLPISIIEGMASGLAIVATPVGAIEDIVSDGETGLLVAPGDADALAAALTRLVTDRELRQRLGNAGLAVHRARLDIEPYAERLVATWKRAASVPRSDPPQR